MLLECKCLLNEVLNHLSLALTIRSLMHAEMLPMCSLWRWYLMYRSSQTIVCVTKVCKWHELCASSTCHLGIPIWTWHFYVELKLLLCEYRPTTATTAWCHISAVLPCPSSWVELKIMELGFMAGHLKFSCLCQCHTPCGQLFVRDENNLPSSFGYHALQACTTREIVLLTVQKDSNLIFESIL